jgi:hypothetical protein
MVAYYRKGMEEVLHLTSNNMSKFISHAVKSKLFHLLKCCINYNKVNLKSEKRRWYQEGEILQFA